MPETEKSASRYIQPVTNNRFYGKRLPASSELNRKMESMLAR